MMCKYILTCIYHVLPFSVVIDEFHELTLCNIDQAHSVQLIALNTAGNTIIIICSVCISVCSTAISVSLRNNVIYIIICM